MVGGLVTGERKARVQTVQTAKISKCRSCGTRIIWTVTSAFGRRMPVDFTPVLDGDIAIKPDGEGGWLSIVADPRETVAGCSSVRRKSHFATCPNAAAHRKPKP